MGQEKPIPIGAALEYRRCKLGPASQQNPGVFGPPTVKELFGRPGRRRSLRAEVEIQAEEESVQHQIEGRDCELKARRKHFGNEEPKLAELYPGGNHRPSAAEARNVAAHILYHAVSPHHRLLNRF